MGALVLAEQSGPSAPAAGNGVIFIDSSNSTMYYRDDSGRYNGFSMNAATAAVVSGYATDTYIANSDLQIPSFSFQQKSNFLWRVAVSKTAAGVAAPIILLRIGPNRSTADTNRLTITLPAPQTAVADAATLFVMATCRVAGAATVLATTTWWVHQGTVTSSTSGTGFADNTTGHFSINSSAFDSTALGGQYMGLSINGGASASWTTTQVIAEANW